MGKEPLIVKASCEYYKLLLRMLPKKYRQEYGGLMLQLMRDCCFDIYYRRSKWGFIGMWLKLLFDLAKCVIRERREQMQQNKSLWFSGLALLVALASGSWLGYADTRSDDDGITAGLIFGFCFGLGFFQPRRPWLMALTCGLCIPAANIIVILAKGRNDLLLGQGVGSFLALLFAFGGAYGGAGLRRLSSALRNQL